MIFSRHTLFFWYGGINYLEDAFIFTLRFWQETLSLYRNPRVIAMGFLGFSSGLPLLLTSSTLAFWLKKLGLDYTTIGLLSLTALPYTVKFLWAPIVDKAPLPFLTKHFGQRRSWLLFSQVLLGLCLLSLSFINPVESLSVTCALAVAISFSSATQDIAMLAYQMERLGRSQYGAGEAVGIFGYRMGMLCSGAGALSLSTVVSWNTVYMVMAFSLIVGLITVLRIKEPERPNADEEYNTLLKHYKKKFPAFSSLNQGLLPSLHLAVLSPFSDFMKRQGWVLALIIMFTYKIGDNIIGTMHNLFYIELGFNELEISAASKIFGMWASILGGFIGGLLFSRWGLYKSLYFCGLTHSLSILSNLILLHVGNDILSLYFCVAAEHITSGMRLTALFAYQLTLCNRIHAATQLALLTSLVHLGRVTFASTSGWIVDHLGWSNLFLISTFSIIPVLLIIHWLSVLEGQPFFKQKKANN